MPDQKIDNLLNLAMDATPQERRKSGNLNIGYDPATRLWDVIIKYSGPESGLAGNGIQVVPLLGSYAVVTLPESEKPHARPGCEIPSVRAYIKSARENRQGYL